MIVSAIAAIGEGRSHWPRGQAAVASPRRPQAIPCDHLGQADHHGSQDLRITRAALARADEHRADPKAGLSGGRLHGGRLGGRGAPGAAATGAEEVVVIGGSEVFQQFMPTVREGLSHDRRRGHSKGMPSFRPPCWSLRFWEVIHEENCPADSRNRFASRYRVLVRRDRDGSEDSVTLPPNRGTGDSGLNGADYRAARGTSSARTQARSRRFQAERSEKSSCNTQRTTSSLRSAGIHSTSTAT